MKIIEFRRKIITNVCVISAPKARQYKGRYASETSFARDGVLTPISDAHVVFLIFRKARQDDHAARLFLPDIRGHFDQQGQIF